MSLAGKFPALLLCLAVLVHGAAAVADEHTSVIYLVRHADKQLNVDDPPLSKAGQVRSQALSLALKDAGITGIFSSDYRRTLETAAPLAERLKLKVEIYDPRELDSFAKRLKGNQERLLIVGHSNTTPEMVKLLGGDPGTAIDDDGEYDRLYIVTGAPGEDVTTVLLRYGQDSGY